MKQKRVGRHLLRRANADEIPLIMDFIDKHFERGHLLARDRAFFEYEYCIDGRPNVGVAIHGESGSLDGVITAVPASRLALADSADWFFTIWVAKRKSGTPFLGLELSEFFLELLAVRSYAGIGLRAPALSLNADLGYPVEKLRQYYRLADRGTFMIADIRQPRRIVPADTPNKLIPLPGMEHVVKAYEFEAMAEGRAIYKDAWYLERRYFNHPYYRFNVWGIETAPGAVEALLVGRVVEACNSSALRLVDFWGREEALSGIGHDLDRVMADNELEYADFWCLGLAEETLIKAGFVWRDGDDPNVIPDHFEPFEKINCEIHCGYCGGMNLRQYPSMRLFKGDGDTGRPRRHRLPMEWRRR